MPWTDRRECAGERAAWAERDRIHASAENYPSVEEYVAQNPWWHGLRRVLEHFSSGGACAYKYVRRNDILSMVKRWDDEAEAWWNDTVGKDGEIFVVEAQNYLEAVVPAESRSVSDRGGKNQSDADSEGDSDTDNNKVVA